jgi:5-methylcytosine-specific restriction endonuclease McrA
MTLNGRTLTEILPLSDLYTVHREHHRLTVFVNKGRKCVICDREGTLLLTVVDKGGGVHIDLYTDDFVLMTVDHVVPRKVAKELGWTKEQTEDLLNKQPMCDPCNNKKGSSTICNDELKEVRLKNGYPRRLSGIEVIRQLVHNESIFNKNLEGVV